MRQHRRRATSRRDSCRAFMRIDVATVPSSSSVRYVHIDGTAVDAQRVRGRVHHFVTAECAPQFHGRGRRSSMPQAICGSIARSAVRTRAADQRPAAASATSDVVLDGALDGTIDRARRSKRQLEQPTPRSVDALLTRPDEQLADRGPSHRLRVPSATVAGEAAVLATQCRARRAGRSATVFTRAGNIGIPEFDARDSRSTHMADTRIARAASSRREHRDHADRRRSCVRPDRCLRRRSADARPRRALAGAAVAVARHRLSSPARTGDGTLRARCPTSSPSTRRSLGRTFRPRAVPRSARCRKTRYRRRAYDFASARGFAHG